MIPSEANRSTGFAVRPFLLAWATACAILLASNAGSIIELEFPDPDDALRLLQVRDWLAGQAWYDISQHRINAPAGGDMHWSRLVDLPIAAIILLLRPFVGAQSAELAALVIVPLLTLGVAMALTAAICARLLGREQAIVGAFILPLSVAVTHQLQPMRIDHHGWQIAAAAGAVLALLHANRLRSGLAAGTLIALWLNVSMEGLPFAAAVFAWIGLRWILDPREAPRLAAAALAGAGVSLLLYLLTRNPLAWSVNHCDAVSPAHLYALGMAAIGSAALVRLPLRILGAEGSAAMAARAGGLALVGAAALAVMVGVSPDCAGGPFARLNPLVHDYWYLNINEGLPLWRQMPQAAALIIVFPLIALVGTALATRSAEGQARTDWAAMMFMLTAATLTACLVVRAGSVANLLAVPGGLWLFRKVIDRGQLLNSFPAKLAATAGALALVAPGQAIVLASSSVSEAQAQANVIREYQYCTLRRQVATLNALPPSELAVPLDIAPAILVSTHHRVIASGHHRNSDAMADVIRIFTLPPEQALTVLRERNIGYVAVCPDLPEPQLYAQRNPNGLWNSLANGRTPEWLERVHIRGAGDLHVWRVRPAAR